MVDQSERMSEDMSLEWLSKSPDIDIETFYKRSLLNFYKEQLRFCGFMPLESAKKRTVDRAVQTEPELNDISPSWMIATESQLCKLHTNVVNMLNTLHDMTDSHCRRDMETMYEGSFTYVDGYWQSISHPEVKYPASGANLALLKLGLKEVMKITSRLRDDFPYIAGQQGDSSPVVDKRGSSSQKVYAYVEKTAVWSNVKPCTVGCYPCFNQSDVGTASCSKHTETDFHARKPFCNFQSIPSTCGKLNTKKEYSFVPTRRALGELNEAASLFPTGSKCLKGSLPKITNKDPSGNVGNQANKVSTKVRPRNHRDFIKRNILAVKSSVVSRKRIR